MRTFVLGICISISSIAFAQRDCATQSYMEEQKRSYPSLSDKLEIVENFIRRQKTNVRLQGEGAVPVIKIPVVVHVLYSSPSQNISEAQVKSQIEALNRDFRRDNADSVNTPERFKSLGADVQIEFILASSDPKGRTTNGIVRKQTSVINWKADDKIKSSAEGGSDAWDSRYYLNIWVGNLQYVIGYSTVPGSSAEKDGVVIATSVFGTIDKTGSYNLGRTTVHEVGHWLGLKHIWGDYYCGDDLVDDTPKQGNFTPGCPNTFRSSCNNGSAGDMYMNYMDYTGDACLNLFTQGQKERMRSLFNGGGPRNSLLYSKGLNQPWVEGAPLEELPFTPFAKLYPNPAINEIVLNLNEKWVGKKLHIVNANGVVLSTINIASKNQAINLTTFKTGMYFLHGDNGVEKLREKFIKL
jgi:hypothetical protein